MENLNWNGKYKRNVPCLSMLPEDCFAKILALTSPLDVCRISLVSKSFQSAAESDSIWERFLPSDYQSIMSASLTPFPDFPSKKNLYMYLCHHPLLIDAGRKSFSLEKLTGKKCYFLGARDLNIPLVDRPQYWKWISLPESRFPEVAKLKRFWSVDIEGTIRAGVLSPQTSYAAYLVYKFEDEFGFSYRPSKVSVGVFGVELDKRFAILVPEGEESIYSLPSDLENELKKVYEEAVLSNLPSDTEDNDTGLPVDIYLALQHLPLQLLPENVSNRLQLIMQRPKLRDDGWFEVELGEFYTENEDDRIEMNLEELKDCASLKTGLIVEGIEIRPRMG
ncbi:putative F-box protein PP2-B12 [Solanum dulcamara]|uniref:putative F-box protein PP2-B12 n=1 Tax=Solanum dulcamara TaxID=45834 RepID=UPI002485DB5B|nr:putative F-box protein PP2-B12 [Solanum dulcamara]